MPEWAIWLVLLGIFLGLVIVQILLKSKKPVRKAISGALTGLFS